MRSWRSSNVMNVGRHSFATTHCSAISSFTLEWKSINAQSAARSSLYLNTCSVISWFTLARNHTNVTSVVAPSHSREVFKPIAVHTQEWSHILARSVGVHLPCSHLCCPTWGHTARRRPSSALLAERPSHTGIHSPGMSWSTLVYALSSVTSVVRLSHRPMISSAIAASTQDYDLTSVTSVARTSQWSSP